MAGIKTKLNINHNFPSLKEGVQEAVQTAKKNHANIKKDRTLTKKLLGQMHDWLCDVIGKKDASAARYDVNYDPSQPYDYFGVCICFKPPLAAKLHKSFKKFAPNPIGKKSFPFKLTQASRQDTVGLTDVDLITTEDQTTDWGYTETGLYLQFSFVEW